MNGQKNPYGDPEGLTAPLDLEALAETPAPAPRFLMRGIACGHVATAFGAGASGKSFIELHRAVCIAKGQPFFGVPTQRRRALFLACEDDEEIIHLRLQRICAYEKIDLRDLMDELDVMVLPGKDVVLYAADSKSAEPRTPAYNSLADWIKDLHTEYLVIDGIADVFAGNENDKVQVKQFYNTLTALIPRDRGAVMLVGHVSKVVAGAPNLPEAYSGSAAWSNYSRGRFYYRHEQESSGDWHAGKAQRTGRLLVSLEKANYEAADLLLSFRWDHQAGLFVGELVQTVSTPAAKAAQDATDKTAIIEAGRSAIGKGIDVPAAVAGPKTSFHVLSAEACFPAALKRKAARTRFWRLLREMRSDKVIEVEQYTSGARHPQERLVFP